MTGAKQINILVPCRAAELQRLWGGERTWLQRVTDHGAADLNLFAVLQMLQQRVQLRFRERAFGCLDKATNRALERFESFGSGFAASFQVV